MIPLIVFAVLWLHGSTFGLTDDEAYYWVLAQRPDWGYAYHPPMIAWSIAVAEDLVGWLFRSGSPAPVRLVSSAYTACIVALAIQWFKDASTLAGVERSKGLQRGAVVFLGFAGMFALSWMTVPDLPLFTGWMLAFTACFRLCFRDPKRARDYVILGVGVWIATLSKYSGVAIIASAGVCLGLWAPRRIRHRGWLALLVALVLALIPILVWNARHDWGSLIYQLRDRHEGGQLSWMRYLRFWLIQLVITGPLFFYAFRFVSRIRRGRDRVVSAYAALWAAPAAFVYFIQPLWADFKPHWALIVWLPFALELGLEWMHDAGSRFARSQVIYGFAWIILVFIACHDPIIERAAHAFTGKSIDPKLDVTNDMYGWSDLPKLIEGLESSGRVSRGLPVVGSRYQTASQAAFSLGRHDQVALIPRDIKQFDEWPRLDAVDSQGPAWPRLLKPVLFVADNRYDAGPGFRDSQCELVQEYEKFRATYLARKLRIWLCIPDSRSSG